MELPELLVNLLRDFLLHGAGLLGGREVAGTGLVGEVGELVIEADGEVEGVLVAAVLGLVKGFLHGRHLLVDGLGGLHDVVVGRFRFQWGGEGLELPAQGADVAHGVVGFGQLVAHLLQKGKLRLQVGRSGFGARVGQNHELGFLGRLLIQGEAGAVGAGHGAWPLGAVAPQYHALKLGGLLVAHVPDEAVKAFFGQEQVFGSGLACFGLAGFRVRVGLGLIAEGSNQLAGRVQNFQLQGAGGVELLGQVVVQQHAAGVVLAGSFGDGGRARALQPVAGRGPEQVGPAGRHGRRELVQGRDVVNQPEAPALGGGNQLVVLAGEVRHGHGRQVQLEGLPARAVVERHVEAVLGAAVEQAGAPGVGPHHAGEVGGRDAGHDAGPAAAVVGGFVEVGAEVAGFVAGSREVGGAFLGGMGFDAIDEAPLGQGGGRHLAPGFALVAGELHQPVVRARPDDARFHRRLGNGEHGAVVFHAGVVLGQRPARRAQGFGVVARQVGANGRPRLPLVGAHVQVVRAGKQLLGVVGREHQWEIPLEAVLHALGPVAHGVVGPHVDEAALVVGVVHAGEVAVVATAVHYLRVQRVDGQVGAFAAGGGLPVARADGAAAATVQNPHRGVVLLRPVDAVGKVRIRHHAVELAGGLVVVGGPVQAAVGADLGAAVVGNNHSVGVFRGNPQVVVVAVRGVAALEGAAPVLALVVRHVHHVEHVLVAGVGIQARVVPGPLA